MITNLSNLSRVTNQTTSKDWLTESRIQTSAPFHDADFCYNTENCHTYNILDCYIPKHPDVCFLRVSVSLLENRPNKVGIE
jgi:hypothetical protein